MRSAEIRDRWLEYFRKHDHEIVDSVPLVSPDPSILFTIAGMVPFIPYIIGTEPAPFPRAASVQKCIRTNDIDNVGRTTRHGTFFQMCGNFSFGDYFKEGAIDLAFGLLTTPVSEGGYGLDGDRLWVTIWEEDKVSYDALTKTIGMDPKHIVKLKREEIFWSTGQPGPAGPCAEIHYDRGPEFGPEAVGGTVDPGGDRYLEIWNLVFDEFLRGEGEGKNFPLLGNLDQTAIDTGAGLERIAYLLQGKRNMYETDQVYPVIAATEEMTGKKYGANEEDDVRMRIIADHVRSSLMLIGDGVRPGNDGRGYVLRRLIRRAVRSVRLLGVDEVALPSLLPASMNAMKESYPEVGTDFDRISQIAYAEEEAFRRTLSSGTQIFDVAVDKAKSAGISLPGSDAFTLHDTYGFPIDLTLEMAAEKGIKVDEQGFRALMQEQKDRARADAQAKKSGHVDATVYHEIQEKSGGDTEFLGYSESAAEARVLGILQDGKPVPAVEAPAEIDIVLDRTPFWAEQGGQLADRGEISISGGGLMSVDDVQMPVKGLHVHRGTLTEGKIALDDTVYAQIDTDRRGQIARAHTATHMIHKALHEHLGEQATQAGSENAPSRLRFDFRHGSQIPADVMGSIEARVNSQLQNNLEVTDEEMEIEKARELGAMALFGEKYGKVVRVVSIGGDWSRELCAGTHVKSSGEIGLVTVLGESSIGSGVRRIEALVGREAYASGAKERALLSQLSSLSHVRSEELPEHLDSLLNKLKAAEKQIASLRKAQITSTYQSILNNLATFADIKLASYNFGELSSVDEIRGAATDLRNQLNSQKAVVALFGVVKDRPLVVVAATPSAIASGVKAGALVSLVAKILGGGGGGKDDLAQGGGADSSMIAQAMAAIEERLAHS
ncbi:alanyl-tRNA synthetase [Arcanobacterium pluranimalium]|uniref:alanine--tRNA ligase n=1 Tax=Arcanobacterium pluranimalium TaxID=108028 RepID=UPI00195A5747|nr:alanine--tRNA ligase [Arcanobacterium pluranimalium]MBM7825446.1 alanyl-tRNA synthetase [Arcanobacterium pluranimalium]